MRTGVEFNGERILELFEPGDSPFDSALEWFIDVRWQGARLPSSPETIRSWLIKQNDLIGRQLQQTADELSEAGMDSGWPLTKPFANRQQEFSGKIVCSAVRRLDCREIRRKLLDLKSAWPELIRSLPAFHMDMAA